MLSTPRNGFGSQTKFKTELQFTKDQLVDINLFLKEYLRKKQATQQEHGSSNAGVTDDSDLVLKQSPSLPSLSIWQTNPVEHNHNAIQKILFSGQCEGIGKVENNSTGWLFSTSKNLLALWECIPNPSEPLKSSYCIYIEERILSMDIAESSKTLVAASVNTETNIPYIALYSLESEKLFEVKAKISTGLEASQINIERKEVVSLEPTGGPLRTSIACAIQRDVVIYDINQSLGGAPKATWTAHEDLLCLLRRNPFSISLFSGSWNGSLYMWDLKTKPSAPAIKFMKHERAITSAEMINEYHLYSSSADASVFLWDIRNTSNPLQAFCPDGKSVLNLKVNTDGNLIAYATLRGVLQLMSGTNFRSVPLSSPESKVIFPDMCWDNTGRLYAAKMDGAISVYDKTAIDAVATTLL